MIFHDMTAYNAALWRKCGVHDEPRDDGVCPGCAADARPACTWCQGTGLLTHVASGHVWPQRCHHCILPHPIQPDPEEFLP